MKKIVILGGGLSGLAAAQKLCKQFDVIILEKKDYLGGLAASFEHNKEQIPIYYHHVIQSNKTTQRYLKRYGLLSSCRWQKIKVAIGWKNKIYNINTILGLLLFNQLSFTGKIRLGLFGLYVIFLLNPDTILDNENAEDWLYTHTGKEVTDKIFYNLYARNKFNIPLKEIAAKQFAWRLKEREVYDKFTYPEKGLNCLVNGLKKEIIGNNGKIITKCNIKKINLKEKKIKTDSGIIKYDTLINTIPIPEFLKITTHIPIRYRKKISKVKYCSGVEICFGTKDFLKKGAYWINLFQERMHVLIQHSLLCDKYNDKINWCIRYGGSEQDIIINDKKIIKIYKSVIKRYFPKTKINWIKVFKEKYAEPIYCKDYCSYMPDYETPVQNLYMAGIQITFPKIRNMNTALESGLHVAKIILQKEKTK